MAYNILIVDDSSTARAIVMKTVRMSGVELGDIHEATNGIEALQCLDAHWIDLVFADINMPEMNGLEMVDAMAEKGLLAATPVVMISTERSTRRIEELKAKGISAYLNKPFTPENIKTVVGQLLGAAA